MSPRELVPARLLLHHAVQLVAAVGRSLVPARAGRRSHEPGVAPRAAEPRGTEVPGPRPWRAALCPTSCRLVVLAEGDEVGRLALVGRTLARGLRVARRAGPRARARRPRLSLDAPYTLPAHPLRRGAPFAVPGDGSLARSSGAGSPTGMRFCVAWPRAGSAAAPVRVWPHHFDVGSVLPLGGAVGEGAPSIGIGLSPGDETIAEPYLYVTPWPRLPEPLPDARRREATGTARAGRGRC